MLRDRGALLKEEGDVIREYRAVHEENILSSWLREEEKEKEERMVGDRPGDQRREGQKEERR